MDEKMKQSLKEILAVNGKSSVNNYHHGQSLFLFSLIFALMEEQDEEAIERIKIKAQEAMEMIKERYNEGNVVYNGAEDLFNSFYV